jgi:hypothetical protein
LRIGRKECDVRCAREGCEYIQPVPMLRTKKYSMIRCNGTVVYSTVLCMFVDQMLGAHASQASQCGAQSVSTTAGTSNITVRDTSASQSALLSAAVFDSVLKKLLIAEVGSICASRDFCTPLACLV